MQTTTTKLSRSLALLLLICLLALSAGCGASAGLSALQAAESFDFELDPASFELGGSGKIALGAPELQGDGSYLLPIDGRELKGLRSLYCTVGYDAGHYSAVQFLPAAQFDTNAGGLSLAELSTPGVAELGMVLKQPLEQPGLSGALRLGQLRLQPHAAQPLSARRTSLAPNAPGAKVDLKYDEVAHELSWYYSNPGDYNQDGRVAVSDLTPIGLHFDESGPWDESDVMAVVDGNGDGKITVADLTPIGLNFGRRVEGYTLFGSASPSDYPDNAPGYGTLAFANANAQPGKRIAFKQSWDVGGELIWVRPNHDDDFGTPSNAVSGNGGNIAPSVTLTSDYSGGALPLVIMLSAAATDIDGSIVKYEFDLDNNGVYEEDNGTDSTLEFTAITAGSYAVAVRVTDNAGLTATQGISIVVSGNVSNEAPTVELSSTQTNGAAPLALTLTAEASDPDGSIVSYAFNVDGAAGNEYEGPESSFDWTYTDEGLHVAWVEVTDNKGATALASVDIHVGETQGLPPFVFCSATPSSGSAPLAVDFDASNSLDLDGGLAEFRFDFTHDGVVDQQSASPLASHTYANNGLYTAYVVGVDTDGNFNFKSVEIQVGDQ